MKISMPSRRICEEFHFIYELKGAQRGIAVLTEYYGIRRMKIVVDGRRVGRGNDADYFEGIACFTRRGLNKGNVLHELYHHIAESYGLEIPEKKEERLANLFVREVMKKG